MTTASHETGEPETKLGDGLNAVLDNLANAGLKIGPRERINAAALTASLVGAGATRNLEELKPLLAPLLARSLEERRLFFQAFSASPDTGKKAVDPPPRAAARPWLPVLMLGVLLIGGVFVWRTLPEPTQSPLRTTEPPAAQISTAPPGGGGGPAPSQPSFDSLDRIAEAAWPFEGAPTIEELAHALAADLSPRKLNWPAESYAIRLFELSGLPRQRPLPLYAGKGLVWARLALALERIEQPGDEHRFEQLAASAAGQAPARLAQEPAYDIAARLPEWLAGSPASTKAEFVKLVRCSVQQPSSCSDARQPLGDDPDEFRIERALAIAKVPGPVPEALLAGAPWLPHNDPAANTAPAWVPWIAALVPLALALLWLANSLALRKAYLRRRPPQVPPLQVDLVAEAGTRVTYAARQFGEIAKRLQRRTPRTTDELDIRATIAATIATGGEIVTPVYREARDTPEYLVLIERSSAADQDALRLRDLIGRLEKLKLMQFTVFYFSGEPSFLEPDGGRRAVAVEALKAGYGGHRLVILGSGAELLDPASLAPHPATAMLRHWERRALLTPLPLAEWGREEFALAHALDMPIGRATLGGLLILAELLGLDGAERDNLLDPTGDGLARPLPEILRIRPQRFLYGAPPASLPVPQLIQHLRNFLDGAGFEWLCALAVYPAVQWDLTLYLGLALRESTGAEERKPIYREDRIAALTQLPWLREGQMPNWVRRALIAELRPDREAEIRAVLQRLLERADLKGDRVGDEKINLRIARDSVRDRLPPEELFEDEVLLDFLARGRIEDLAVHRAGGWLERLLPRRWIDRIGIPELGAGMVAAAYVGAAAMLAPKPADGPLPTGAWLPLLLLAAGGLLALGVANPAGAYRTVRGALVRLCTPALGFVTLALLQAVVAAASSSFLAARLAGDGVTLVLAAAAWLIADRIRDRLGIPRRRPRSRVTRIALPAAEILVMAVLAGIGTGFLDAVGDDDLVSQFALAAAGLTLFTAGWMAARLLPARLPPPRTAPLRWQMLWSLAGGTLKVTLALLPILLAAALARYVATSDQALAPLHGGASAVAETPDGEFVALGEMDGHIRLFKRDGARYEPLGEPLSTGVGPAISLALGRVGNRNVLAMGAGDGKVGLNDLDDDRALPLPDTVTSIRPPAPARVALDPDGMLIAAVELGNGTSALVTADGRRPVALAESGPVTAIAALGKRRFAVATLDGRLRLLIAPAGEPPDFAENAELGRVPGRIRSLRVDAREGRLLAIGDDGTLLTFQVAEDRITPVSPGQYHREEFALGEAKRWKEREQIARVAGAITSLSRESEGTLGPGESFRECEKCPEMVVVPAGSFTMGSSASEKARFDNEGPQHQVTLARPFAIGKFAVTFAEWDACVAGGGCKGYTPSDIGLGNERPFTEVSWDDAKAYVAWLSRATGKNYRLLSEAEREYAARGGTITAYWWGDEIGRGNANCNGCGSQWDNKQTAPVGSFPPNAFGLYDMSGNAWEWTEDCWHDSYVGAPADGSAWTTGDCSLRVLRGGSWYSYPQYLRSASRNRDLPGDRIINVGFRVARTLSPPAP
jgi:formylglycine-generating enzyme required for sulfatase activity